MAVQHSEKRGSAIDLLETEDLELRRLFTALRATRGPSVEERAEYGNLAKEVIQHVANMVRLIICIRDDHMIRPFLFLGRHNGFYIFNGLNEIFSRALGNFQGNGRLSRNRIKNVSHGAPQFLFFPYSIAL